MTKVNYTAHPFSPNDKPLGFEDFDPEKDVKVIDGVHYFPSDILADTEHQINKLPNEVWGDYSEYIEGLLARAQRMLERWLSGMNRSEVPLGFKELGISGAVGVAASLMVAYTTNHFCHQWGQPHDMTERAMHVLGGTAFVGAMHAAQQVWFTHHDEQESSEEHEMMKQALNQVKKAQVALINWRESNDHPKLAELEAKVDAMVQSYEHAIENIKDSREHAPWWKVAGMEAVASFAGAMLGPITYAIGNQMLQGEHHEKLSIASNVLTTVGLLAAGHAATELMRPQHVNTTSVATAQSLFKARDLARETYKDAVLLRRNPETAPKEAVHPSPSQEQMIEAPLPDAVIHTDTSQRHGMVTQPASLTVASPR